VKAERKWKADPWLDDDETLEPGDYSKFNDDDSIPERDRGHQAPLAAFKGTVYGWQTNYLSNITPQNAALNQGPWVDLEAKVRDFAKNRAACPASPRRGHINALQTCGKGGMAVRLQCK